MFEIMLNGFMCGIVELIGIDVEDCKGELFDDCVGVLCCIIIIFGLCEDGNVLMVELYEWISFSWVVNWLCELLLVLFKVK